MCIRDRLGAVLVIFTGWSVIGTLVVPRRVRSALTRLVAVSVRRGFQLVADRLSYAGRDRVLAAQAPVQLIAQIVAWLASFELGFGLLLWPFVSSGGLVAALVQAGSSLCTLGYFVPGTRGPAALDDLAALTGLGTVALQIGYLPTLYAAFNRRETLVAMLESRAGVPSWGPELLARTCLLYTSGSERRAQWPPQRGAAEGTECSKQEQCRSHLPRLQGLPAASGHKRSKGRQARWAHRGPAIPRRPAP